MSYLCVCDHCGKRKIAVYDEAGYPGPPPGWREFQLSDWRAHGCSDKCMEKVKTEQTEDPTPTASNRTALP